MLLPRREQVWARRAVWGVPEEGAGYQYIPDAGAGRTSSDGEEGGLGRGGKAV